MSDFERLEKLIGKEFDESEIIESFIDEENEVIVYETTVKSNFNGVTCTCWNAYYNTEDATIYNIWIDINNIIVDID